MKIYIPYKTLEEKQAIKDQYGGQWALVGEDHLAGQRVLIYDDGTPPPFTIPDEVTKAGFLVILGYVNGLLAGTYTAKTPQDLLNDVKTQMGV